MSLALEVQHGVQRLISVLLAIALITAVSAACHSAQPDHANSDPRPNTLEPPTKPTLDTAAPAPTKRAGTWTGDFDVILEHRMIRMLVSYSPTLFYHDRGQARGVIAAASVELEKFSTTSFRTSDPSLS